LIHHYRKEKEWEKEQAFDLKPQIRGKQIFSLMGDTALHQPTPTEV
jgi:hypothetical protein